MQPPPTPDHDPIGTLQGAIISIKLGLNFDRAGIDNAMTHVLVLSVEVRRNERSWLTLDIGNMLGPTFGFKNVQ